MRHFRGINIHILKTGQFVDCTFLISKVDIIDYWRDFVKETFIDVTFKRHGHFLEITFHTFIDNTFCR